MKDFYVIEKKGCDEFTCGKFAELSEAGNEIKNEQRGISIKLSSERKNMLPSEEVGERY